MDRFSDRVFAGQDYASGGLGYVGPDDTSLARQAEALAELVKRADERLDGLRSLADFVAGGEPTANSASGLKPVPFGLGAEMRERITALENRLNSMAHEFGRLDRAIRG